MEGWDLWATNSVKAGGAMAHRFSKTLLGGSGIQLGADPNEEAELHWNKWAGVWATSDDGHDG
eukprot:10850920-Prorocentrum_lima.AAC.1